MTASLVSLPAGLPTDPALLATLLDLLPMGVMYYTPIVDAGGTLTDLTLAYLNPAAQRMTRLPAEPGTTYRQQFPTTDDNGAWDFHRRSWLGQEPQQFRFYYDADGFDNYFRVMAQRLGQGLLTIFTDTQDEDRSEVEKALHLKQAREQAARAEAEQQAIAVRETMRQLFDQAPVAISMVRGPQLVVELLNEEAAALLGSTQQALLGKPLLESLPIVREQGLAPLFERVLQGEVFTFDELPITFSRAHRGQSDLGYYRVIYQPWRDGEANIIGMVTIAIEVSEQVLARQQVQHLNEALATSNEALRASNAEYQRANSALDETQQQLRQRNQELEAARAEVEADRQRLYQVLMRMPANIALLQGPAHVYDFANAEYARLFPSRHLLGRSLREVIPELDGQGFYELFDRVYETGEPFYQAEAEAWADYADTGEMQCRYYRTTFEPIRNPQGQITEVLNFAVDVTAQVVARQQVEQLNAELEARVQARTQEAQTARQLAETQKQRLEQLFLQAPAAICILTGPELVYELANPAYQLFFPGRALYGLPLLEALPELRDQPIWRSLQQVYRTGATHQDLGARVPLACYAGGPLEDFYFDYVFQARRTPKGHIDGVVVFCFDVTEQIRVRQQIQVLNAELTTRNEELHASNTQLTRTNVDLDTFVYTASHDLKTPISNIESITLALRDTLPPAVQQDEMIAQLLELLEQTTTRFQLTIGQLTDLSKLQLAHAGPAEPVHLATVIEAVYLDLAPLIAAANAQLTVEVAPDLVVSFSPVNLRSAVYNLLSNAVKYRALDRPAHVWVRAFPAGRGIVLEVQDNGLGLNAHQQGRLFGLFQRLHTHVEGTGVGLYITKRLVENGGGTIAVASQEGVGTTFTLSLPA